MLKTYASITSLMAGILVLGAVSAISLVPSVQGQTLVAGYTSAKSVVPVVSKGILKGKIFIGPTCPVVHPGQDCADKPYAAAVQIRNLNGTNKGNQTVVSDSKGRFSVKLPVGKYQVIPVNKVDYTQGPVPYTTPQEVKVRADKTTSIEIHFDNGVR